MSRRELLRAAGLLGLTTACRADVVSGGRVEPDANETAGRVVYTGAQVFRDGSFSPADVVVNGGRIEDVSPPGASDAEPVDAEGLWLIPGFIDAHVHLQFAPGSSIVAGGVTTVRDLGSPPGVARDAARTAPLRVLTAGRILTPTGGYPSQSWGADGTAREVRDASDGAEAVAEQVAAGASVIKVALEPAGGPMFAPDGLAAIVAAAHAAERRVTAHVGSAAALTLAMEQGVDELAHLPLHDVTPREMAQAAEAGMVLVPTLEIRGGDAGALRAVEAFLAAGGTIVYGTDLGNTGTAAGIEQPELRALLDAGMSPVAVLQSATSVAADYLELPRVGRIEAGAAADLVGLRADPLADVAAYDDVALVVAGGAHVVG